MHRRADTPELLDGELDRRLLEGNLRDLERLNGRLGGAALSWRAIAPVVHATQPGPARLLDVGTGAADIPRYLLRRARKADLGLTVHATDVRQEIVDYAHVRSVGTRGLTVGLMPGNGNTIELPDRSFDIVHASLVMHHLEPPAATRLLQEMGRVAARAVVVNDLDRARRWLVVAWVASRIVTGNRYTRHDAPLSVQRAYRPDELADLARSAGLAERARLREAPGYRYALVLGPAGNG